MVEQAVPIKRERSIPGRLGGYQTEVIVILVETLKKKPAAAQSIEIVERKGKGHPDSICDTIMEPISVALCREYMNAFGTILHHNIDKGLLAAGRIEKHFGGGREKSSAPCGKNIQRPRSQNSQGNL